MMIFNISHRVKFLIISVTAFELALNCHLFSATDTWDGGGGDNNWTTGANWDDNTAPVNGDSIIMDGTTRLTNNNNQVTAIDWLEFAAGAGAFQITGNTTTVTNGITNLSSFQQDIGMTIRLGANQTWLLSGGNLLLSGNQNDFFRGHTLIVAGGNRLILSNNNSLSLGYSDSNGDRLIISNNSSLSIYTGGQLNIGREYFGGRTGAIEMVDGGYLSDLTVMGDTRIGTGAGNSSGKFIATNTPSTAANVHLNSHMWVGDNRDGAGSGRSDGQFLLNLGGGNFSFVSNTAGGYEFQVGDGRNIGGAFGEFLLTNFQNAAIGLQSSPSASEMRVGHDGTGTGSGMVTGLMTYARGSNVSILLNNHIRVGENFGYGLLTFDNVTNVSIRTTGELRVGDGTGGAGTGEVRFLNGSMLQRLDVGGVVRIGDEGNNGSWGRFVATNTPNAATGFNFSNTFNVGYGQNHYGQFLLDAGASHIYWVSNQNAGFEFNVGRGDSTEEAWGQVLWTNAQSVGMGFHGANAANIYVGRYGKNASTTELSTGLVRIVGVSNMNLRVNEFQVGYRRAHGEFVFDGVTNLAIRAQSIRIADTDDGNNGFANGFVYGTNGTRLTSFAVDGILHVGTHSNSVGRLIFTNTSQTTDLRIESAIQVGGLGGAVNNTEGEVRFALGGGNMFLLTNANAEFSVGRGNATDGGAIGQFWISNAGNVLVGDQSINHNWWRIGHYGSSANPVTGLVTFSTISNMNVRMNNIDVGFRRAHGELVFDAVTNLTIRANRLFAGYTDDDSQAFATGYVYGTNGTRLSSFIIDGDTVLGRGSNSFGMLIFTNDAQTLNLRMSDGIFVGGQGSVANNTTGLMMFAAGGGDSDVADK
ncbi:hypothetical protein QPK87_30145 [Kamptonema cortianum]|nr:hypothetical protein [Kamptonema cortianum]